MWHGERRRPTNVHIILKHVLVNKCYKIKNIISAFLSFKIWTASKTEGGETVKPVLFSFFINARFRDYVMENLYVTSRSCLSVVDGLSRRKIGIN